MNKWIKKGDKVMVISGNNRGETGEVLARKGAKLLVRGINRKKRHLKKRSEDQPGQIVEVERPIDASNVAPCVDGKRVKLRVQQEGTKKRLVYQLEEKEVVYRELKS